MNLLKVDTYSADYVYLRAIRDVSVLVARFHYEEQGADGGRVLVFEPSVMPAGGCIAIDRDRQPWLIQGRGSSKSKRDYKSFRVRVKGIALNMDAVLSSVPADERDACIRILPIHKMVVAGILVPVGAPPEPFEAGETQDIGRDIAQSLQREAEMLPLFFEPQHRQLFSALDW